MRLIEKLRSASPLVQHVTNHVTMNDCANATLAVGAAPVMTACAAEADQLAAIASALVLNMGTADEAQAEAMLRAGRAAKDRGIPVVFDPVGAGATAYRRSLAGRIMEEIRPDVVKGNAAELSFLAGLSNTQRGVDSTGSAEADALFAVARRFGCVAVATGETDYVCDGKRLWGISGGNETLGRVCGTGCMSASILASLAAAAEGDLAAAGIASCLAMKLAGEEAARACSPTDGGRTGGLSTYRWALMDALSLVDDEAIEAARREKCEEVDERP